MIPIALMPMSLLISIITIILRDLLLSPNTLVLLFEKKTMR